MPRRLAGLLAIGALVLAACSSGSGRSTPSAKPAAPLGDAFYKPPDPLPKGAPGDVIWSAPVRAPQAGSKAWRVLYHSRALDGHDIAVSGVVMAPDGPVPSGGRAIVTWAHGTSGIADACAPSKRGDKLVPGLDRFLAAGDMVVATDYEGLGTPGRHPYLVGESEGRGVLDIARAARHVDGLTPPGKRVLVYGHSQGGHAALFAGQIASSYAPDLDVIGVAAGAPVGDLKLLLEAASKIPSVFGYMVMGGAGFQAAYPEARLDQVLTPQALADTKVVDSECGDGVIRAFNRPLDQVLAHDPLTVPPWPTLLDQNTPGHVATKAPLLVFQGDKDQLVVKPTTDAYVQRACALGDSLDYRVYPGQDHGGVVAASLADVVTWTSDREAGKPAKSSCGGAPAPPGA